MHADVLLYHHVFKNVQNIKETDCIPYLSVMHLCTWGFNGLDGSLDGPTSVLGIGFTAIALGPR